MEQSDKLIGLYRDGETSLAQEELLRKQPGAISAGEKGWFDYTSGMKKSAPATLEQDILSSIEKYSASRRLITTLSSAAAIVIIALSLAIAGPWKSTEMDYGSKVAVLEEARGMIGSASQQDDNGEVLYEDEAIIIYFK
ncbi:MAG: hypothetical protein R2744_08590 [Bacteroidales bacterium]